MLEKKRVCDVIATVCTSLLISAFTLLPETLPSYLIFASLLAGVFLFKTRGSVEIRVEPFYIFEILMILFTAASTLWAANPVWSLRKTRQLTVNFVFLSIVYIAYSKEKDGWPLIRCFKWAGYISTLYLIRFYGAGRLLLMLMQEERIGYEVANSNRLGMGIAWGILFEVLEMTHFKKLNLSCIMIMPSLLVMAATQSRKAILIVAIGVALTYFLYYVRLEHIGRSIIQIAIFVLVVSFILYIFRTIPLFSGIYRRMEYLTNFVEDEGPTGSSVVARQMMIQAGWKQFRQKPILGIGIGCAAEALKLLQIHEWWAYLHNNYIELLAGGGIIGFTIYYARYVYQLCKLIQFRETLREMVNPCLIQIVCRLVIDYALVSYFEKPHEVFFLIVFLQLKYAENAIATTCQERNSVKICKYIVRNG